MKNEIIKKEEELQIAMLTSDVEVLDSLINDCLIFTAPTGDVVSKDMDLTAHRSGIQKLTKLEKITQEILIRDKTAVVASKMNLEGTYGEQKIDGLYSYTRVWHKEEIWKIIAGHVSLVG